MRTVMCTINGQLRPVPVRDRSVTVDVRRPSGPTRAAGQVAAPFDGVVSRSVVGRGRHRRGGRDRGDDRGDEDGGVDHDAGRRVGEPSRSRPVQQVEGGDLVLVVEAQTLGRTASREDFGVAGTPKSSRVGVATTRMTTSQRVLTTS